MRKTWFWNVDPTRDNFSYLLEDQHRTQEIENAFLKNKYKRSCLYFAGVSIESLLNKIMRTKLEDEGKSENKIYYTLRNEGFKGKLKSGLKRYLIRPSDFSFLSQSFYSCPETI